MGLPKKLKKDAVVEAICEIRFEVNEIPEVIIGTITKRDQFKSYEKKRLSVADIPVPIRLNDPQLKYQALVELKSNNTKYSIKVGSNALSIHLYQPYPGWETFYKEIEETFKPLFGEFAGLKVNRIGLRYLNALTAADHLIADIEDLQLKIQVDTQPIGKQYNINYKKLFNNKFETLVRVASLDFIAGSIPEKATCFIDIDVRTLENYSTDTFDEITQWLVEAHECEKIAFFELLGPDVIEKIKEI
jgi:uncharacterized protein (TIGR04255 family)